MKEREVSEEAKKVAETLKKIKNRVLIFSGYHSSPRITNIKGIQ